jgi:site-specific DNA-adenine methylase
MSYPTVNYIGNKEKIVTWISSLIPDGVNSILDVFSGGCSVGYAAKEKGLEVYSNDILSIN